MLHTVYIGLGSNLDNPLKQVKAALKALHLNTAINVDVVSNIYQSKALDAKLNGVKQQQNDYINAVACIKTRYTPIELLDVLQAIELKHNRVKEYRWGPRSLDLDILLYDDLILDTERLSIPHGELANRNFVLYPLQDISPVLNIPGLGKLEKLLLNRTKDTLILIESSAEIKNI